MKPDFRKSMIWLHTYSGLVIGWLLFAIFITGTLSYFNQELSQWMKPELNQYSPNINIINKSITHLKSRELNAERWRIYLPDSRSKHLYIQWSNGRKRTLENLSLNDVSPIEVRDTKGGDFFRTFHYTLQLRSYGGRYIAGVAAMMMLVALFSGIFTHRRFFRDFFTLRKAKLSKLLSDSHALMGIVTLPFCLMICSSALMIYVTTYIPASTQHFYPDNVKQFNKEVFPSLPALDKQAPVAEPLTDFSIIEEQINQKWTGENQIDYITYEQPYRENGRIIVNRVKHNTLSNQAERLVFSSTSGEALAGYPEQSTPMKVRRIFYGLHEAHFADVPLRGMFFILGLLSSALIATGSIIWLNKRLAKVKRRHMGHHIVECLNVAGFAGLLLAVLSYFHANRFLALDVSDRASLEVNIFLWVWLATLLHSILRPAKKAWFEQLMICALLCLSLPFIDFLQDSQRLVNAVEQLNGAYLMFNIMIILSGVAFLKTALWLKRKNRVTTG